MRNTSMYVLNDFVVNKKQMLGKGATGEVYAGKCIADQSPVAIKIIDLKAINNEVTEYLLNMEKVAVMTVNNPHVLKGIKVVQNSKHCHIVTELCNGGTLKSAIRVSGPLGEDRSLKIFFQLLKGMSSLVGKGILHRDLKPANILLHNGEAKIIDFGYCEIRGYPKPSLEYNVGSPSYMSPEAFLDNEYSEKSQIWALGVTFYECLNGKTFDDGKNMADVYKEIKKKGLPYKAKVSEKCRKIIDWCLQLDSKKRPTTLELLNYLSSTREERPAAQSVRMSFKNVENVDFKVKLQEKMQEIRSNIDSFWKDEPRKDDVLKVTNKPKPGLSTYTERKKIFEKKYCEKKPFNYPQKAKYGKREPIIDGRATVFRNKSQMFDAPTSPGSMSDRFKAKENLFGSHVSNKQKIPFKKCEPAPARWSVNCDYYGMATDRL